MVKDGNKLLSNVVASSVDLHTAYGGVVPEIAARSHLEVITPVINQSLKDAFQGRTLENAWDKIDAIAVTKGPGLLGSLLIGVLTARTLAITKNKPLYAVNHVEAHVYATFLTSAAKPLLLHGLTLQQKVPKFPILALIISGGHTQLVFFRDHFDYRLIGYTRDDAVGEAFDKVAKILGLPYPGGPAIAKAAKNGNPTSVKLPKAKLDNSYDFSFSGLKTAVLRAAQMAVGQNYAFPSHKLPTALSNKQKFDLAASFQHTAVETLIDGLLLASKELKPASVVIAGGVAANQHLRKLATDILSPAPIYPDAHLCTDNAAMIAANGYFQSKCKVPPVDPYSIEADPGLSMLAKH